MSTMFTSHVICAAKYSANKKTAAPATRAAHFRHRSIVKSKEGDHDVR